MGSPANIKTASGTNATLVYGHQCKIQGYSLHCNASYAVFLHVYDLARKPIVGTDVPLFTVQVSPNTASVPSQADFPRGIPLVNGFAYSITKGVSDTDSQSVAANDLSGVVDWNAREGSA